MTFKPERLRGLYVVTPDLPDTDRLAGVVRDAIAGGGVLVQYRNKAADQRLRHRQASVLQRVCVDAGVPLVINDDLELAIAIGAAGVHVGRDDDSACAARASLGGGRLLGISCYNQIARVDDAIAAGADIVGIGAMFGSATKPAAVRAPLGLLGEARARGAMVAAIGGISLENAPELIRAGADLLAVISDLFDNSDVAARAADYAKLFASMEPCA
ncbi:MAG: thiamine phosphate synthase [Candidatus Methylophosphatis roskildensis]